MFVCYNPSYTLTSSFVIAPPSPPPPPGLQGGKLVPQQHHKNWDSIHRGDGLRNIIGGEKKNVFDHHREASPLYIQPGLRKSEQSWMPLSS